MKTKDWEALMIVTDGSFFSGCLIVFCLIVFALFFMGYFVSKWLGLLGTHYDMLGPLIVFCVLWWFIRYRRKKEKEKSRRYIEGLEDYD